VQLPISVISQRVLAFKRQQDQRIEELEEKCSNQELIIERSNLRQQVRKLMAEGGDERLKQIVETYVI